MAGTSVSSARQCHKYPGYGYSISIPAPGTCVCSARPYHNTRNIWKFCKTRATIPGYGTTACTLYVLYPLGSFVSYLRPCHNTRNFWEFCQVLYHFDTRTRNFWMFCKPTVPIPGIHRPYRRTLPWTFRYDFRPVCRSAAMRDLRD